MWLEIAMASWAPGGDPFPAGDVREITDFEYLDELKLVCHATSHVAKPPESLWQLAADFRVRMRVHPKAGPAFPLVLKAPRGLHTDLASVPELLWSFVGPIGRHLEASIIHDYLYMAWTDFRSIALRRDWNFADLVFLVGMRASNVENPGLIYRAVHSVLIGWPVFKSKSYTLKERMEDWLPELDPAHGRSA